MPADVALWLVTLLKDKWDEAVESLRSEGETFPKITRPKIAREDANEVKAFRLSNGVLIKVYSSGPERVSFPEWGMRTKDVRADWLIDIRSEHPTEARQPIYAAWLVVNQILEIHRKEPEGDWDLIEAWQKDEVENFADYQHWNVTVTLARLSRLTATAVTDNT